MQKKTSSYFSISNYNLPKGWYGVTGPIMTVNWNAPSDQQWIIPVGAGIGKVFLK